MFLELTYRQEEYLSSFLAKFLGFYLNFFLLKEGLIPLNISLAPRHNITISTFLFSSTQFNLFSPPDVVSPDTLAFITLTSNPFFLRFFLK